VNELEFIESLRPYVSAAGGDLVIGAGEDDVAAWCESDGSFTIASIDTSVERVHFDLSRQRAQDVGWRALAFALSDLAAKGATPTYGLVSVSVPRVWPAETAPAIYAGIHELAKHVGLKIVGGDTTAAPQDGSLTITVLGRSRHRPRSRAEARQGWLIAVTGPLGGAALGTRPLPRLELGRELAEAGLVCGDISDGLLRELDKVKAASGVGARLRLDRIPLAHGATALQALASGEEVELVCLGDESAIGSLSIVGELTAEPEVVVIDASGSEVEVRERGYDHFG
jgi:thiamine-monophosphate kinase